MTKSNKYEECFNLYYGWPITNHDLFVQIKQLISKWASSQGVFFLSLASKCLGHWLLSPTVEFWHKLWLLRDHWHMIQVNKVTTSCLERSPTIVIFLSNSSAGRKNPLWLCIRIVSAKVVIENFPPDFNGHLFVGSVFVSVLLGWELLRYLSNSRYFVFREVSSSWLAVSQQVVWSLKTREFSFVFVPSVPSLCDSSSLALAFSNFLASFRFSFDLSDLQRKL